MDTPVTPQGAKPEWHPPKLTDVVDAATLTGAGVASGPDGSSGS
jgi:hypothetical protein